MKKSKVSNERFKFPLFLVGCILIQLVLLAVSKDEELTVPKGILYSVVVSVALFTYSFVSGRSVVDEQENGSESAFLKFIKGESMNLIACVVCGICAALIGYLSVQISSKIVLLISLIPSIFAFEMPYILFVKKKEGRNIVLRRVVLIAEIVISTVLIYWLLQCFNNVMNQ